MPELTKCPICHEKLYRNKKDQPAKQFYKECYHFNCSQCTAYTMSQEVYEDNFETETQRNRVNRESPFLSKNIQNYNINNKKYPLLKSSDKKIGLIELVKNIYT